MFEKYIIVPGSLRNTADGFCLDVRIGYYRGIGLSMVEGFELSVDGTAYDPGQLRFGIGGLIFRFAEMASEMDVRWEFTEAATLYAPLPGGLAPGPHDIAVVEILRISYMPEPARRVARATLQLN